MNNFLSILIALLFTITCVAQEVANIERYQGIPDTKAIHAIVVDSFNNKWIGTDQGLYKINSFYNPVDVISEEDGVLAIAKNRGNGIWAARHGLDIISVDLRNKAQLKREDSLVITSMMVDDNWLWVGTNQGAFTVSITTYEVSNHYTAANSKLITDQINVMHRDQFGVKWIGTNRGLIRIGDKGWKLYEKNSKVTAITTSDEGTWVAAKRDTWLIDKHNRWYPIAIDRKLSKGEVHGLTTDSKGRLYVASQILVQYNPFDEVISQYDEESGYVDAEALSIAADNNDEIWVGTADRGLFRIEFTEEATDNLVVLMNIENKLLCNGHKNGSIKLKIRGGEPPYRIKWNKPQYQSDVAENLKAGTYAVTVSDGSGKYAYNSTTLTEPAALAVTVTQNERISSKGLRDGKAAISVLGGTPGYTYEWSNGSTLESAKRLKAGKQLVTVKDNNGCQTVETIEIKKEKLIPELAVKQLEVGQTLRMKQLFFEADSTIIKEESYILLEEVLEFLQANPVIAIEIGGHTNNIPKDEYCDMLSNARAKNVAEYMYRRGIPKEQLTYKGYGKRNPVASNMTDAGRKRNQRVEIKILSLQDE